MNRISALVIVLLIFGASALKAQVIYNSASTAAEGYANGIYECEPAKAPSGIGLQFRRQRVRRRRAAFTRRRPLALGEPGDFRRCDHSESLSTVGRPRGTVARPAQENTVARISLRQHAQAAPAAVP